MFSFFKKKKIVAHLKLSGVIGNAGKFRQGIDFAGQEELIKKVQFSYGEKLRYRTDQKDYETNQCIPIKRYSDLCLCQIL